MWWPTACWTLQIPEFINGFNSVKAVEKASISVLKFFLLWGFHFWSNKHFDDFSFLLQNTQLHLDDVKTMSMRDRNNGHL